MKKIQVSMPEGYYDAVKGLADAAGVSFAYVIRDLIRDREHEILQATEALRDRGLRLAVKREHK